VEASRLNMWLKILTFAMVFLGVVAILLTGYFPAPQPLIVIPVLVVGFFLWESKIHSGTSAFGSAEHAIGPSEREHSPGRLFRHRAYSAAWYILTFIFLAWCCYDLFSEVFPGEDVTVRIPMTAMRLSIFLQIFKVYNAKADRDYVHMFVLSFFQFVSCAGVSVELYVLPLVLLYLVVAMWALTLFHFRKQLKAPEAVVSAPVVAPAGKGRSGRLLTRGFFTGTLLASGIVALLTAVIFISFPRSATSDSPLSFQTFFGSLGRRLSSGLSDYVDLNIAGIINRDPRPVMRVAFPTLQNPPHTVLWRWAAMHRYDAKRKRWRRPDFSYASMRAKPSPTVDMPANIFIRKSRRFFVAASDSEKYNSIEDVRKDPELVPQQYTLFYTYSKAPIFSAFTPPVAVEADVSNIAGNVDDSYYCRHRFGGRLTYTVFSRIPRWIISRPTAPRTMESPPDLDEEKRRLYTRLPRELNHRFGELAKQVTGGVSSDYKKAQAVRNYLSMHCQYSLDLTQRPGRRGPLYDFLFANKPGHCEYFASAMVILMRELGVPSRLAYGYSTGRWDPERKTFLVRRLDAHAWAEVFVRGRGWTHFDPTPVLPEHERPETFFSILLTPLTNLFRVCENQWAEGVIGYSRFRQKAAFRFVVAGGEKVYRSIKQCALSASFAVSRVLGRVTSSVLFRTLLAVGAIALLGALAAAIVRLRRGAGSRLLSGGRQPGRRARLRVKFYEKMLRLLRQRGMTKQPADTPLEFADRVAASRQPLSDVRIVTDLYYFVRFGNGKLTPEQSRTIQSVLQRLSRPLPGESGRD